MTRSSDQICTELRHYNKDKGWPLAHEAADKIQELEKEVEYVRLQLQHAESLVDSK